MNPIVHVSPMSDLSPFKRKKLCEHDPQCQKFVVISTLKDGMTMCEKDALDYCNNVYATLQAVPQVHLKGGIWTIDQTKDLIEFLQNNDVRYGTYSELAVRFGKTRIQVKDYVHKLRRKGAF